MSEKMDTKDIGKSVYNTVGSLALAATMLTSCAADKDAIQNRKNQDYLERNPNSTELTNQNLSAPLTPIIPELRPFSPKIELSDLNTNYQENNTYKSLLNESENILPIEDLDDLESSPIEYTDTVTNIEGQEAYIAVPSEINPNNPPKIVMFNHGSNTRVTTDMKNQFMLDLKEYAELFTSNNFIFCASNAHGENWGNAESITDNLNMINWVRENYKTNPEIYIIGFSMGGLTSMRYVQYHPDNVAKIALLAPTIPLYDWNSKNINILENIDIQIWHGTNDSNININNSKRLVEDMKELGKEIKLLELKNKTHFDIDTEYMKDILKFFLTNSQSIQDF